MKHKNNRLNRRVRGRKYTRDHVIYWGDSHLFDTLTCFYTFITATVTLQVPPQKPDIIKMIRSAMFLNRTDN